jgi:hypothetical protein
MTRQSRSWTAFERRFEPQPAPDHDYLWEAHLVPKDADGRVWWTVLDCDGRLYLSRGFRIVNRFAYVRCANPWTDEDADTEYRYD